MKIDKWGTNTKGACKGCPHYADRERCIITGLRHPRAVVTFLLDYPTDGEANNTEFGKSGMVPTPGKGREIASLINMQRKAVSQINILQGRPGGLALYIDPQEYNLGYLSGYQRKGNPLTNALDSCRKYIDFRLSGMRKNYDRDYGDLDRQHILVPMGAAATAAVLGVKGKFKSQRGKIFQAKFAGHQWTVVPTLSLRQVMATMGLASIVVQDIETAYRLSYGNERPKTLSPEDIMKLYTFPQNDQELLDITEHILQYTGSPNRSADDWPIAVDTETNSLDMYKPDSKMLMMSLAWDKKKATTICLDHPEMPYSRETALDCITRLMASPKPKAMHNYKFDYGVLELNAKIPVNNVTFDTMLGAHYLYEEMRGFFGLDALTTFMVPEYTGFKGMIQDALKQRVRDRLRKDVGHAHPDVSQSYHVAAFFPDIEYTAAIEDTVNRMMIKHTVRDELWAAELAYLQAFEVWAQAKTPTKEQKSAKTKTRGKVSRMCKKYNLAAPPVAKKRDYSKELQDKGYENIPFPILLTYAAADADVTRQIYKEERRRAWDEVVTSRKLEPTGTHDKMFKLLKDVTLPASRALAQAQFHGTQIDMELLARYETEIGDFRDMHEDALQTLLCDPTFNPKAGTQVERVFRHTYGILAEDIVYTPAGKLMAIRKDWLEEMEDKYSKIPGYEDMVLFIFHLRRFKSAHKAADTFLTGIRNLVDWRGRIHTQFNLNGTSTGRLSSNRPNLQNIPHYMCRFPETSGWNIKQLFIPDEGQVFWQLDIAAAEIRVLCAYAEDPELIDALKNGLDIHSYTTAGVFDMPYSEVMRLKDIDPEVKLKRTAVKRVVFGALYGAGDEKIAEQIYGSLAVDLVRREEQVNFARDTRLGIFSRFPRVGQYITGTKQEVQLNQVVETFFGRRRRFDLANADRRLMGTAKRQAVNFKIQSTASDILISQLVEMFAHLHEIEATFQLTVHDSLCGSVPYNRVKDLEAFFDHYIVDRVQEKFDWLPVPFAYDLEVGPDYGRAVSIDAFNKPYNELSPKERNVIDILNERHCAAS